MKKSKVETAETRKRIIEIAGQEFRRNGIHGTSVSEIMATAGLTHGGFYRHFDSKEQLIAEACAESMDTLADKVDAASEGGEKQVLKMLREFLSLDFHDDHTDSCSFVTMGSELARADTEARRAVTVGFRHWVDAIATLDGGSGNATARAEAMFKLSAMIGAATMARIVDDKKLSDQLLREARKRLADVPKRKNTAKT